MCTDHGCGITHIVTYLADQIAVGSNLLCEFFNLGKPLADLRPQHFGKNHFVEVFMHPRKSSSKKAHIRRIK